MSGYKIQLPKVPEGLELQEWSIKAFETVAHHYGLTPEVAQGSPIRKYRPGRSATGWARGQAAHAQPARAPSLSNGWGAENCE